jgi:hypothetical protein
MWLCPARLGSFFKCQFRLVTGFFIVHVHIIVHLVNVFFSLSSFGKRKICFNLPLFNGFEHVFEISISNPITVQLGPDDTWYSTCAVPISRQGVHNRIWSSVCRFGRCGGQSYSMTDKSNMSTKFLLWAKLFFWEHLCLSRSQFIYTYIVN